MNFISGTESRAAVGRWPRESGLFALGGRQVMLRRCRTPRSIVFPPIILSKLIYDRLFGRWTVGEAWCACTARAHVCGGSVRASPPVRSYLQMALGTCSLAQRSRKLGNDVSDRVLFSFITMHKGITQPYLGSALLTSFCYAYLVRVAKARSSQSLCLYYSGLAP